MGRKEKLANEHLDATSEQQLRKPPITTQAPTLTELIPPSTIISKRVYTRHKPHKVIEPQTESIRQTNDVIAYGNRSRSKIDETNTDIQHTAALSPPNTNSDAVNSEHNNKTDFVTNVKPMNAHTKRSSTLCPDGLGEDVNQTEMEDSSQAMPSTISQRPRRQVRHKYIQSVNQLGQTPKVAANDTFVEINSPLSFNVEGCSPKRFLVPVLHRLSITELSISDKSFIHPEEVTKMHENNISNANSDAMIIKSESTNDGESTKEPERVKNVANSKTPVRRSGRQLVNSLNSSASVQSNDSDCEDSIEKPDHTNLVTQIDSDDSVIEETTVAHSDKPFFNVNNSKMGEDSDNDDITIVEAVDPLSIDEVAEEVVIQDTTDVFEIEPQQYVAQECVSTAAAADENETICLSDSLSCFDSDSDAEADGKPMKNRAQSPTGDRGANDAPIEMPGDPKFDSSIEDHIIDSLNESIDDIIVMSDDSENEAPAASFENRFGNKMKVEECENVAESPQLVETSLVAENIEIDDCLHVVDSEAIAETMQIDDASKSSQTGSEAKKEIIGSHVGQLQTENESASLNDTTTDATDADDDSNGLEGRLTRSRRDNVARKTYSYRRNYASRRAAAKDESQPKQENSSSESDKTSGLENATGNVESFAETAATDGDDESHLEFSFNKNTSMRTYQRRRAPAIQNQTAKPVDEDLSRLEPLDVKAEECNRNSMSRENANASPNILPKKRGVGRPRKNANKTVKQSLIEGAADIEQASNTEDDATSESVKEETEVAPRGNDQPTQNEEVDAKHIEDMDQPQSISSGEIVAEVMLSTHSKEKMEQSVSAADDCQIMDSKDEACESTVGEDPASSAEQSQSEMETMDVDEKVETAEEKTLVEVQPEALKTVIEHMDTSVPDIPNSEIENIAKDIKDIAIDAKPDDNQPPSNESDSPKVESSIVNVESALSTLPNDEQSEAAKELLSNRRRSGRIKTINKIKQRSQGLGLVKDQKRTKNLGEEDLSSDANMDNSNADKDTPPETTVPREKTQEELDRLRIDRENGYKLFAQIVDNEYRSERTISKEAKKMSCDCFLTPSEIERGELGCGEDCLNRMLLIECGPKCTVADRCTNKRFQKHENADCTIFKTEKKGYGLMATSYIPAGTFVMEYVGEVLNSKQFEKRVGEYSDKVEHYYFMALSSDCVIDATKKGNISRFINHSCDPNAETQKWTVNGELRIGFFSKKPIMLDEEITFDYQFQRYGKKAQRCYCGASNCCGWIGGRPDSDDELIDDDDDDDEDESGQEDEDEQAKAEGMNEPNEDLIKKKVKAPKPKKVKDATYKPAKKERKATAKLVEKMKKQLQRSEILEDIDIDKEIDVLEASGLKNANHVLTISRLMVRAKLQKAKTRILQIIREGVKPCRRVFIDYNGLKLMHSWMSDINDSDRMQSLSFRLEILKTLESIPVQDKTKLQDSKVLSTVQRWTTISEYTSKFVRKPNDESSPSDSPGTPTSADDVSSPKIEENSSQNSMSSISDAAPASESQKPASTATNSTEIKPSDVLDAIPQILEQNSIKKLSADMLKQIISTNEKNIKIIEDSETNDKLPDGEMGKLIKEIRLLASKLITQWESLPESFKIPKKLRIQQMKEHEREADQSYKENLPEIVAKPQTTFTSSGRFIERTSKSGSDTTDSREKDPREKDPREKDPRYRRYIKNNLSKEQRRQMFAAKVAQENAERKKTIEQITREAKCAFFQLDFNHPKIDLLMPTCVNPRTGQWYGQHMNKVPTPPSHRHIKPPPPTLPTDINEYNIPAVDLPDKWKYGINDKGQIYYYHAKILIPQWEPPIKFLPLVPEEHRINEMEIRVEGIEHPIEEDHEMEHDYDDEDEDVVSILSNSKINPRRLLEVRSDPDMEDGIDDDSSSSDSDDSLNELEAKYAFLKERTVNYRANMSKLPNLSEEIAAMAKSDSGHHSTPSSENNRMRDDEKLHSMNMKSSAEKQYKKKKCRAKLVQEIRIDPLSEEEKKELRRDSRRYKENKAKLRRQKDSLLVKRKQPPPPPLPNADVPVRKLKKLTEGLPLVPKHETDIDMHADTGFSVTSFSSSRYNNNAFDLKRPKASAFSSYSMNNSAASTSSINSPLATTDADKKTLHSIVNKLPSIGHKFDGNTEELIMKNTINTNKPTDEIPSTPTPISSVRSTPTPQFGTPKLSPKLQIVKRKKVVDAGEPIDMNSALAKKKKNKFLSDISGDIVRHLKPYLKENCQVGHIQNSEDFKHLARKLTHFVMLKELKYCNNVGLLEVTESVKVKAREYIKKYMSKFGEIYVRDENEKDYRFDDL